MKNAILDGSQMTGINLRIANLKGASMQNCVLHDAVLAGADLEVCIAYNYCFIFLYYCYFKLLSVQQMLWLFN